MGGISFWGTPFGVPRQFAREKPVILLGNTWNTEQEAQRGRTFLR